VKLTTEHFHLKSVMIGFRRGLLYIRYHSKILGLQNSTEWV